MIHRVGASPPHLGAHLRGHAATDELLRLDAARDVARAVVPDLRPLRRTGGRRLGQRVGARGRRLRGERPIAQHSYQGDHAAAWGVASRWKSERAEERKADGD
eukprot:2849100-Prymnesium_polylepis.1